MKKALIFFLVVLLFSGCAPKNPYADTILPHRLTAQAVNSLPVAREDMTKDELRQLCVDYFALQVSFQWIPGQSVTDYPATHYEFEKPRTLDAGRIYGGIPYQSLGTGNLYRWLEYYDEASGTFDIAAAIAENGGDTKTNIEKNAAGKEVYYRYRWMRTMFNQCSVAAFWGWGRVVNSANFAWTTEMNVYNGFIPVGGYTYGYTHEGKYYGPETIQRFGVANAANNPLGYDTKHVIADWNKAHGSDAMYTCYAQMKPADCLVSGGHAMMVRQVNLFYNEDGSVNYRRSTVTVLEQVENWGQTVTAPDGSTYLQQGRSEEVYSFAALQKKQYIPFTFAEFLEADDPRLKDFHTSVAEQYSIFSDRVSGTAGVEKGEVYLSADPGDSIGYSAFQTLVVGANYPISDVFVTVTDKSGAVVLENIYRADTARCREVAMGAEKSTWEKEGGKYLRLYDGLRPLADGTNTVTVTVRLSTGETIEALSSILTN